MFLASFYYYLNHDNKNDFVIDLDNVWQWLSFGQKVKAKVLLEKYFILNKDYTLSLSLQGKRSSNTKGGHNKEIIMLNIKSFNKFCSQAFRNKKKKMKSTIILLN